jgi:hypothetical protein
MKNGLSKKMDRKKQNTCFSLPGPSEILWGRGNAAVKHPGNNTCIAEVLLLLVKGYGGQFIKLEKDRG